MASRSASPPTDLEQRLVAVGRRGALMEASLHRTDTAAYRPHLDDSNIRGVQEDRPADASSSRCLQVSRSPNSWCAHSPTHSTPPLAPTVTNRNLGPTSLARIK